MKNENHQLQVATSSDSFIHSKQPSRQTIEVELSGATMDLIERESFLRDEEGEDEEEDDDLIVYKEQTPVPFCLSEPPITFTNTIAENRGSASNNRLSRHERRKRRHQRRQHQQHQKLLQHPKRR